MEVSDEVKRESFDVTEEVCENVCDEVGSV